MACPTTAIHMLPNRWTPARRGRCRRDPDADVQVIPDGCHRGLRINDDAAERPADFEEP